MAIWSNNIQAHHVCELIMTLLALASIRIQLGEPAPVSEQRNHQKFLQKQWNQFERNTNRQDKMEGFEVVKSDR